MQIKITLDRVILPPEEVQQILKTHIEKQTGRKVHGVVMFENVRAHASPSANCELEEVKQTLQFISPVNHA